MARTSGYKSLDAIALTQLDRLIAAGIISPAGLERKGIASGVGRVFGGEAGEQFLENAVLATTAHTPVDGPLTITIESARRSEPAFRVAQKPGAALRVNA